MSYDQYMAHIAFVNINCFFDYFLNQKCTLFLYSNTISCYFLVILFIFDSFFALCPFSFVRYMLI